MDDNDKIVALRTLINVVLRDLGLSGKDVYYTFETNLDRVTAFCGNKQVCIQFGDNLDMIEEITVGCFTDVIYQNENLNITDMHNKGIVDAIQLYDFGDYDE